MELLHTLFYFIVAIVFLVSCHEFGHFWVARKMGVKVLKFSIGFGKPLWTYQKDSNSTEYILAAIPLGGYVKMLDEREGKVSASELPLAFNQQPLLARTAIVIAGPIFNLILAIGLYWAVFMLGETGMRPIIAQPETASLAFNADFQTGDEIIAVNQQLTPTWREAISLIIAHASSDTSAVPVQIKTADFREITRSIQIPTELRANPQQLYKQLGLKLKSPELNPIIGKILPTGVAFKSGLQVNDVIISADNVLMQDWNQWVEYVQQHPAKPIELVIARNDVHMPLTITPESVLDKGKTIGKIGAGVFVPEAVLAAMQIHYSLPVGAAFIAACKKTAYFSSSTLTMIGKMFVGKASVENLSGPISIAQYAGKSAEMGLVHFLKFMAIISISLGVLNLLPIPMLDGGHLMFYAIEAIKGSPVLEATQAMFQQAGMLIMLSLMLFAMFLDIGRWFT